MACLREHCPSAWILNQSAFVQGNHPDPVLVWMAARKKKLTHPLPEAGHSRGYLKILWPFYSTSSSPPPLCSIKETSIQTPIRWFFGDTSLPSSWSAGFPNKVIFLASTPHLPIHWPVVQWAKLGLSNKSISKREVYINTVLPQETRKITMNKLTLHLKQLEKEEQRKPKVSRRKEIINIRAQINRNRNRNEANNRKDQWN